MPETCPTLFKKIVFELFPPSDVIVNEEPDAFENAATAIVIFVG